MQNQGTYWLVSTDEHIGSIRLSTNAAVLFGRAGHNHVVLNDYRISRQHARVAHERDGYFVYDLNSSNGTLVNGEKVRRHRLSIGDEISLGPFVFRFEERAESSRQIESAAPASWQPGESITRFGELPVRFPAPAQPEFDLNSLEHAYKHLGTVYDFVQAIGRTIEKRELLEVMGGKILEIFPSASSVCVYLRDGEPGEESFQLAHYVGSASPVELQANFARAAMEAGAAFGNATGKSRKSTEMYAPMLDRGEVLGVICVKTDGKDGFSAADIDLLNGMAAPAAIALKNTHYHEQMILQERLRRDLELAAQIQMSFLPREIISIPGVDCLATYRAAYTVGGDFYDIFWVGPSRLAIFIGDISGKGIAAALLMARISGELRIAALTHVDPLRVLTIMNGAILDRQQPELYFTAVFLTLDVVTGDVLLACAGHPTPYLCCANGDVAPILHGGSTAVGMFEEPAFASARFRLEDRDSLVLYTDGVVEATDRAGATFGDERLHACLVGVGSFPDDISASVLANVEAFTRRAAPNDDLTIFVLQRCVGAPVTLQPRSRVNAEAPDGTFREDAERTYSERSPLLEADTLARRPPL